MKAISVTRPGGADALAIADLPIPEPGPGEARVRIEAAGVNYIDIYHRTGLYPVETPFTPGMEGAGTVDAVGEGVTEVKPGDRVAYLLPNVPEMLVAHFAVPLAGAVKLTALVPEPIGAL